MTKYIENLNLYLDARKIKQTYLSMKTGIDAKKMSRILTGVQDITGTDMEKISAALGENTEYFLRDPFPVPQMYEQEPEKGLGILVKGDNSYMETIMNLTKYFDDHNVDDVNLELEGMYVECQGDDVIVFFPNIEA